MDARCNGSECSTLKSQSVEEAIGCTKLPIIDEDVDGCECSWINVTINIIPWMVDT